MEPLALAADVLIIGGGMAATGGQLVRRPKPARCPDRAKRRAGQDPQSVRSRNEPGPRRAL